MKTILVLFTCALGFTSLSAAPEETSHEQAAEKLLRLINPRETFLATFTSVMTPMLARIPEEKQPAVKAAFMRFAESVADSPELESKMVAIYKETFTESELNELLAFYSTPVGKKSLSKMGELMQKGALVGKQIAEEKQAAFQAELQSIMKPN